MNSIQIRFKNDPHLSKISLTPISLTNSTIKTLKIPNNTDLIPGKYEGGLKIWECSVDLINFLPEIYADKNFNDEKKFYALDLGCGHGLPGLYLLLKGAIVVFQDFNREVLDLIVKDYIVQIKEKSEKDYSDNCRFIDGDWGDFGFERKFDLIVSGDTLYNIDNYDKIYNILYKYLDEEGVAYFATKKFYFGVGGSAMEFIDFVRTKGDFEIEKVKEITNGISNIRNILKIEWNKGKTN